MLCDPMKKCDCDGDGPMNMLTDVNACGNYIDVFPPSILNSALGYARGDGEARNGIGNIDMDTM